MDHCELGDPPHSECRPLCAGFSLNSVAATLPDELQELVGFNQTSELSASSPESLSTPDYITIPGLAADEAQNIKNTSLTNCRTYVRGGR